MQILRINLENKNQKSLRNYSLIINDKIQKIDSVKENVYVKYVTEDGTVIEEESEVLINAKVGTKYTTEQKNI
ncbi:hypothetical protein GKG01_06720 [Finegoldia sp. BIOML-A4]|uniref:MucBP domain-containing protein n=1 Tax=unclassified Finegoldia TaxID=2619637 RepID=UPI0012B0D2CF|nr:MULTISPECIES: MucBP domain-containing protein [unclassified Finegoldia]MSB93354.1 hypothetical protein [Finegoldia sp. BIOML-A4]